MKEAEQMQEFLGQYYLWLKALHLIAVMAWMAGMLYLPRLFVYHVDAKKGSKQSEVFKIMEKRLLRLIINPAMIVSFIIGGIMLYADPALLQDGWMHVKLLLVFIMSGVHGMLAKNVRMFGKDENQKSAKYFRILNEVPTALMVVIVVLVIVRPF